MEFVDIHCHMLSGVDDGAKNADEMFSMLDRAYEDGIRSICFTPHYDIETFGQNQQKVQTEFAVAGRYAAAHYPDLRLCLGSEISFRNSSQEDLRLGKCHTLAGDRYVLVDFLELPDAQMIFRALEGFCCAGYMPVVAHVERYPCLARCMREIEYYSREGVLFQINATSLTKTHRDAERKTAEKLLFHRLIDVVATDTHDLELRPPVLSAAYETVRSRFGEEYATILFQINPGRILENMIIRI